MPDYLLDCNHLSAALRASSAVRKRLQKERRSGTRFVTCHPVLCELEAGIQQTARIEVNRQELRQLLKFIRLWPLDSEKTRLYGTAYIELRKMGRVLSEVDIILAALARQHKLTLLTTDRDFEALADLRIENWVA